MKVGKREEVFRLASFYSRNKIGKILGISHQRVCQILGPQKTKFWLRVYTPHLIKTHPKYFGIRHNFIQLMWEKIKLGKADECWFWMGGKTKQGYGIFRSGSRLYAHVIVCETYNGVSAGDLWVLHKCNNPSCCNPTHLYFGTPKQNSADREERYRRGELIRRHQRTE